MTKKYDQTKEKQIECPICKGRGWYLQRFSDNHGTTCVVCLGNGLLFKSNGITSNFAGKDVSQCLK